MCSAVWRLLLLHGGRLWRVSGSVGRCTAALHDVGKSSKPSALLKLPFLYIISL